MRKSFIRQVKLLIVVLLGYLMQVSVMPYFRVGSITPSILIPVIAIITVGYGKLRAFWIGAIYGIVMETMLPTVPMLNLMLYPVSALFCSVFFADRSAAKLQYERSMGKAGRNRSPYLRTVLCTAANTLVHEVVNVVYMYLGGTSLSMAQVGKSLTSVLATTVLAMLLMYPVRKLLGFRAAAPENPVELRFSHTGRTR